jgi:long-chain acyl-CoA synthetase
MNIYPTEIEQDLLRHPAIVDCAVFGVRQDLVGEVPHAVVQVADGVDVSSSLTAEIMEFLNKNLSAMKMPRRIEYLQKLPRDPNGKLFKRLLYAPSAAR